MKKQFLSIMKMTLNSVLFASLIAVSSMHAVEYELSLKKDNSSAETKLRIEDPNKLSSFDEYNKLFETVLDEYLDKGSRSASFKATKTNEDGKSHEIVFYLAEVLDKAEFNPSNDPMMKNLMFEKIKTHLRKRLNIIQKEFEDVSFGQGPYKLSFKNSDSSPETQLVLSGYELSSFDEANTVLNRALTQYLKNPFNQAMSFNVAISTKGKKPREITFSLKEVLDKAEFNPSNDFSLRSAELELMRTYIKEKLDKIQEEQE